MPKVRPVQGCAEKPETFALLRVTNMNDIGHMMRKTVRCDLEERGSNPEPILDGWYMIWWNSGSVCEAECRSSLRNYGESRYGTTDMARNWTWQRTMETGRGMASSFNGEAEDWGGSTSLATEVQYRTGKTLAGMRNPLERVKIRSQTCQLEDLLSDLTQQPKKHEGRLDNDETQRKYTISQGWPAVEPIKHLRIRLCIMLNWPLLGTVCQQGKEQCKLALALKHELGAHRKSWMSLGSHCFTKSTCSMWICN